MGKALFDIDRVNEILEKLYILHEQKGCDEVNRGYTEEDIENTFGELKRELNFLLDIPAREAAVSRALRKSKNI